MPSSYIAALGQQVRWLIFYRNDLVGREDGDPLAEHLVRGQSRIKSASQVVEPMLEHFIRFQHILNVAVLHFQLLGNFLKHIPNGWLLASSLNLSDEQGILIGIAHIRHIPTIFVMTFNTAEPVESG